MLKRLFPLLLSFGALMVLPCLAAEDMLVAEEAPPCESELLETPADFEKWILAQEKISYQRLQGNITHENAKPGVVLASPQAKVPDYFYHWVRDAALVMKSFLVSRAESFFTKFEIQKYIRQYFHFEVFLQDLPAPTGLGEPKFHADGRIFDDEWGRPQNDGPGLRAIFFSQYAEWALEQGLDNWVRENLYSNLADNKLLIERDLNFVMENWQKWGFDLWEEKRGHHFYTRYAHRRALLEGAKLARLLKDTDAAERFEAEALKIEAALEKHFSKEQGYIVANIAEGYLPKYPHPEWDGKTLDISTILGLNQLYNANDGFLPMRSSWVMGTVHHLEETFRREYDINNRADIQGIAMGRYEKDHFDGDKNHYGNPWFLATLGTAEYYYNLIAELSRDGNIVVDELNRDFLRSNLKRPDLSVGEELKIGPAELKLLAFKADSFLHRVKFHLDKEGRMAEQFDRYTGYQKSARDLSWSYAAFISSVRRRASLDQELFRP
jgi:glucoamylase